MRFLAIEIFKVYAVCMHVFGINAIRQEKFKVQEGVHYSHRNSVTISVRSRIECAAKCMSRPNCKSADAEKTNGKWQCSLSEDIAANVDSSEGLPVNDYAYIAVIDECDSNPCINGASCSNLVNGYSCACAAGYEGTNCEAEINECETNPCDNNGTCTDQFNMYSCACTAGYTGANCETDIDECAGGPCVNGGVCSDQVNGYICTCDAGYTGTTCESDIDECASSPCANGGVCSDHVNGYNCVCEAGYTGTTCESKQYLINIHTGSSSVYYGSSSRFYMTLHGASVNCDAIQLPVPLLYNSVTTMTPTCPVSMGALTSVTVRIHSGDSDVWVLDKLVITDNLLALSYTLPCSCRLDSGVSPVSLSVESVTLTV